MFYPTLFGAGSSDIFDAIEKVSRSFSGMEAFEEGKNLVIRVELPGYDKGKISVAAERGVLTITANKEEEEKKGRKYLVRSRSSGSFSQSVVIPSEYDESSVEASYEAGILSIRMPRNERSRGRQIDVK